MTYDADGVVGGPPAFCKALGGAAGGGGAVFAGSGGLGGGLGLGRGFWGGVDFGEVFGGVGVEGADAAAAAQEDGAVGLAFGLMRVGVGGAHGAEFFAGDDAVVEGVGGGRVGVGGGGEQRNGAGQEEEEFGEVHAGGDTVGVGKSRRFFEGRKRSWVVGGGRGCWGGGMALALLPGLVSITFRKHSPEEIVAAVRAAGLAGIEWGGDGHVPHNDLAAARRVRELTEQAGLQVAAYGSYYRVGRSESEGLSFERVLETAVELGAPTIRVWPGTAGSEATDEEGRWKIVRELQRIGDLASRARVSVSLEYHRGTLTDTDDSANQLLVEVDHRNVFTYWQPQVGAGAEEALAGLRQVAPRLSHVHVFHWGATSEDRRELAEGAGVWARYLAAAAAAPVLGGGGRFALLEFVRGDTLEQLAADAATLRGWL